MRAARMRAPALLLCVTFAAGCNIARPGGKPGAADWPAPQPPRDPPGPPEEKPPPPPAAGSADLARDGEPSMRSIGTGATSRS